MVQEQIVLFCNEGGSDKEYRAQVIKEGEGFVVNFQYGRRGQALKSGTKTSKPVDLQTAQKVYNKILAEKLAKGYTASDEASGGLYVKAHAGFAFGRFLPQLCNSVEKDRLKDLFMSEDWGLQEKLDGERRSIQISLEGGVVGLNRRGLVVDLPESVASSVCNLYQHLAPCVVDGEIIGDKFYIFDLIMYENGEFANPVAMPLFERYRHLSKVNNITQGVVVVPLVVSSFPGVSDEKEKLFDRVEAEAGEGVVFKKLDSIYRPGRPNSGGDWLKFKFVESASCVVLEQNQQRSVKLGLYDQGNMVDVGNVTIPPNHDVPDVRDVVEIRYLYAYQGGCLFQPVYLGKRSDIRAIDCGVGQLKYKNAGKEKVAVPAQAPTETFSGFSQSQDGLKWEQSSGMRFLFTDVDEDDDAMLDLLLNVTSEGIVLDLLDPFGKSVKTGSVPIESLIEMLS